MKAVLRIGVLVVLVMAALAATAFLLDIRLVKPPSAAALDRLRALPYLEFSEETADPARQGVVLHDKDAAFDGYNLYGGTIIDMQGRRVHRWGQRRVHRWGQKKRTGLSHRVAIKTLLEDGSVLATETTAKNLLKLDWHSSLIRRSDLLVHHEAIVTTESTLLALTSYVYDYKGRKVEFDDLLELSQDLEVLSRWSTWEHFDELRKLHEPSPLDLAADDISASRTGGPRPKKSSTFGGDYDYYHTNSIQQLPETPLGKTDPRFQAGNILLSLRNVNLILLLDRQTRAIVWSWGPGVIQQQHMPRMLPNGHILIFDNGRLKRGYSRVIELDPIREEIVWEYRGDPPESFYTLAQGSAQRLGNGNTLIAESGKGRVFEVNSDGRIVWEWFNPKIRNNRRTTIYRMIRIPRENVDRLLAAHSLR